MPDQAKSGAGLENVSVTTSSVCWIDGAIGKLLYRGYNIHDLAKNCTFEEVAYLLFKGELPTQSQLDEFSASLVAEREVNPKVFDLIKSFPLTMHPMEMLRTATSYLSTFNERADSLEMEDLKEDSLSLTAQIAMVVAAIARHRAGKDVVEQDPSLSHAANFLYMMTGEKPNELSAKTMDVCLILHAEHGFNASTFTGRVVAATMSDMYSAVTAAIGALKGPLHGGANTAVMKMLLDIGDIEKVDAHVDGMMERKEKVMGMGHRVYKTYDPRAEELNELSLKMGESVGNTKWLEMSERIWKRVHEAKGLYPNVDFFSASTYYTMGIDPEIYTLLFAVSRITGWCAHVIEQLGNNRLIRPRAEYTGEMDVEFVPMDKR